MRGPGAGEVHGLFYLEGNLLFNTNYYMEHTKISKVIYVQNNVHVLMVFIIYR